MPLSLSSIQRVKSGAILNDKIGATKSNLFEIGYFYTLQIQGPNILIYASFHEECNNKLLIRPEIKTSFI